MDQWIRSSFCAADSGQCVEWRRHEDGSVEMRDSKLGEGSPVLRFNREERDAFVAAVGAGEF